MNENRAKPNPARPGVDFTALPTDGRCRERLRDGALERYARTHGLDMDQVHREMERCLAEGGSIRRFFNLD